MLAALGASSCDDRDIAKKLPDEAEGNYRLGENGNEGSIPFTRFRPRRRSERKRRADLSAIDFATAEVSVARTVS